MSFLKMSEIRKSYGEGDARVEVLKDITTSLEKGDFASPLGPSGSGKSTFLNLVGGLEHADGGSIIVNGLDITQLPDKEVGEYRRAELAPRLPVLQSGPRTHDPREHRSLRAPERKPASTRRPSGIPWALGAPQQVPTPSFRWPAAAMRHRARAREEPEASPMR